MIKKIISSLLVFVMVVVSTGVLNPLTAMAASITSFSDTVSDLTAAASANHTIVFTSPSGVASGGIITLTFDNSTSINASLTFTDIDVLDDGVQVTLAAAPSGATAGVVRTSATVITYTNGTTVIAGGSVITFRIGTNATNQSTGVFNIANGSVGTTTLAVAGSFGDTGTLAMPIITNSVVTVSATVSPTITFALSSNTVALGTLTTGAAGTGTHTASASTNAPGGFAITYNGATLTSGANTIAVYTAGASSPGTAGFGINLKDNATPNVGANPTTNSGTCAVATNYNSADTYAFVASTATAVTAVTAPADCVYTVSYIANISSITPAGSYTTAINYINTGTF